jgi:hypothetical protein
MMWIKEPLVVLFEGADDASGADCMETKQLGPSEIETAMRMPSSVFAAPEDEILWRWAYDAAEQSVAVEEGMPGEDGDLLGRIMLGLGALSPAVDIGHTGPSKQHGLPRPSLAKDG